MSKEESDADKVRNEINKFLGKEILKPASHVDFVKPRISTGSILFDDFLGGGMKAGSMGELFGPPSSGKTTLVYMTMANAIKMIKAAEAGTLKPDPSINLTEAFIKKLPGMRCAFVDFEKTFDEMYAEQVADLDIDYVDLVKPEHGNQGIDIIQALVGSGSYLVVACDTIAAMVPKHDAERRSEQQSMGTLAKMMSEGLRKINGANEDCLILFLNQIREKIGVMYGSPVTTTGGNAMSFYASQRFHVSKAGKIEEFSEEFDANVVAGHEIRIKCEKDKVGKMVNGKSNSRRGKTVVLKYRDSVPGIARWDELRQLCYSWGCIREGGTTEMTLPAVEDFEEYKYKQRGKYWVENHVRDNEDVQDHLYALYRHKDELFNPQKKVDDGEASVDEGSE